MILSLAMLVGCSPDDPAAPPVTPPAPEEIPPVAPPDTSFTNEPMASVPLFGGTMAPVTALGQVLASDPSGDRLLLASVGGLEREIPLGVNARPFRLLVEDTRAFVT